MGGMHQVCISISIAAKRSHETVSQTIIQTFRSTKNETLSKATRLKNQKFTQSVALIKILLILAR